MNCQEYREIVSAHVDGALSLQEQAEAQSHLDGCDPCTRIFHWELKAAKAIKQKLSTVQIDPAVRSRLLQALEQKRKRPPFGWFSNQYRLAAALTFLIIGLASVLVIRTNTSPDIFTDIVAQHQKLVDGAVPMSNAASQQSAISPFDLRPWGYRLLALQPAQHEAIRGSTFLYAKEGQKYLLAQEFKGGTLSVPAGARSIQASGKTFVSHTVQDINLVAWKDKDVLCILAAKLPQETLLQLAERLASTV